MPMSGRKSGPAPFGLDVCPGLAATGGQPGFWVRVVFRASLRPGSELLGNLSQRAHVLAGRAMPDRVAILRAIGHVEAMQVLDSLHNQEVRTRVVRREHQGLGPLTDAGA